MLKFLEGLHHWAAQRITGMTAWRTEERECEYPLVVDALETTGIWAIKEYIQRQKGNITEQVAFWAIYDICTWEEMIPRSSRMMR